MEHFYLWDTKKTDNLHSLRLTPKTAEYYRFANSNNKDENLQDRSPDHQPSPAAYVIPSIDSSVKIKCSVCTTEFNDRESLIAHYDSDIHSYNQDIVLKGKKPISEAKLRKIRKKPQEEQKLLESTNGDNSSDGDEDSGKQKFVRNPRFILTNGKNHVISFYKNLLYSKKSDPISGEELLSLAQTMDKRLYWVIIMESGGHFAGAVFKGNDVLVHKSFHSYTVRKGQGGSQGSCDNKSATSHPRSAGASLRRYNEASHYSHIKNIIQGWAEHFEACDLIFLRSGKHCQHALFHSPKKNINLIPHKDARIRNIPFSTKKPTFREVKRAHRLLTEVKDHGEEQLFVCSNLVEEMTLDEKETNSDKENDNSSEEEETDDSDEESDELSNYEEETDDSDRMDEESNNEDEESSSEIIAPKKSKQKSKVYFYNLLSDEITKCVQSEDTKRLESLFRICENEEKVEILDIDKDFQEWLRIKKLNLCTFRFNEKNQTILHSATELSKKEVVLYVLKTGKCDLTLKDDNKSVAYSYGSKRMKLLFRNFYSDYPNLYDYERSLIPIPQNESKVGKELSYKQKKKQEKRNLYQLSDAEKRAIALEKKLNETSDTKTVFCRCFRCENDMSGKIPYTYQSKKFCSMSCMKEHKSQSEQPTSEAKDNSDENKFSASKLSEVMEAKTEKIESSEKCVNDAEQNRKSDWQKKLEAFREKNKTSQQLQATPKPENTSNSQQNLSEREKRAQAAERRMKLLMGINK